MRRIRMLLFPIEFMLFYVGMLISLLLMVLVYEGVVAIIEYDYKSMFDSLMGNESYAIVID
jgi:hypothetical protein